MTVVVVSAVFLKFVRHYLRRYTNNAIRRFIYCYIRYSSNIVDVGEGTARSWHHNRCDTCQRTHFRGRHNSCCGPRRSSSHSSSRFAHATAFERTQSESKSVVN